MLGLCGSTCLNVLYGLAEAHVWAVLYGYSKWRDAAILHPPVHLNQVSQETGTVHDSPMADKDIGSHWFKVLKDCYALLIP
jgi:hypothetical protein